MFGMKWLGRWWRSRQRGFDLKALWPQCVRHAPTIEDARWVFKLHCQNDRAWTMDYDGIQLEAFIARLK